MTRLKHKTAWALILLLGSGLIFLTGLFLCLEHPYVQRQIQDRISSAIPGRVSWEGMSLSLAGGRLSLEGLRLSGADDAEILYLQGLSVWMDLPALLGKRLVFPRIRIDAPRCTLAVDSRGTLNLISAVIPPDGKNTPADAEESGPKPPIEIGQFELAEGALDLTFQDRPSAVRLSGLSVRLSRADLLRETGDLILELTHTEIQDGSGILSFGPLILDAGLDGQDLAVRSLDLNAGFLNAVLKGRVKNPLDAPVVDLVLSANARPEAAPEHIRAAVPVSGPMSAELILKGGLTDPEIRLTAGSQKLEIQGRPLQDLDLAVDYKDRTLSLKRLTARTPDAKIGVSGRLALGRGFPGGIYDWAEALDRLAGFFNGRPLPEDLTAQLDLTLKASDIKVDGIQDIPALTLSASASIERDNLVVSSLKGTANTLDLTGSGRFTPAGRTLAGRLEMGSEDLGPVAGLFGLRGSGGVKLQAGVSGTIAAPNLSLDLEGRTISINSIRLGDLRARADTEPDGRVRIRSLTVDNRSSHLRVSGHLDLFDQIPFPRQAPLLDLDFTVENFIPADFVPETGLKGQISGQGRIKGSPGRPEADLNFSGRSLAMPHYTIGDADAALRLSQGILAVDTLILASGNSRLAASGRIDLMDETGTGFTPSPHIDLTIERSVILLEDFLDHAKGGLSLEARVSGRPDTLTGNARLKGEHLVFAGQAVDALSLDSRFEAGRIFVSDLTLSAGPGAAVKGRGWFDAGQTSFDLSLAADDFPLAAVPVLREKGITAGRLSMAVSGSGTLDAPAVSGKIGVKDPAFQGVPLDPVNLDIVSDGRTARVTGQAGFSISGAYEFVTRRFEADLNMTELVLASYLAAAGLPEFSGKVSGRITARGPVDDPAGVEARAELSNLALSYGGIEVGSIPSLSAVLEKGRFAVSETRLAFKDRDALLFSGNGELGGDIRFYARGRMPMAIVDPFIEELSDITGHILVSADLSGSLASPQVNADLTLEDIGGLPEGMDNRLHGISGRILITADAVDIHGIEGFLDRGRFTLSGRVGWTDFIPQDYALGFSGRDLLFDVQDMMDLKINTDLVLEGDAAAPRLAGEIVLLEGRYYKDVGLGLLTSNGRKRPSQPAGAPVSDSPLKAVSLDIDINHRDPFVVDNNLAFLSISPDLRISGTARTPVVTGRTRVDTGTLQFQKNEFQVNRGIIDFVNPYRTEAAVDVQGQAEVRSWTVFLSVTGPPDNLKFTLTSTPSEEHGDILSLLLFGKTTRELRKGEGGTAFSPEQILAGYMAGALGEEVRSATGLDYLETRVDRSGEDNRLGVGVTVGKDLSRQMTVKYGVDRRGGETVQRVTTDYKLLKNFLMSGFQDTGGHYGGELKYRLEFR